MPDVIPFLTYEDGIAALDWLAKVFGFTETVCFTSPDGKLSHGEMAVGLVMSFVTDALPPLPAGASCR